MSSRVAINGLGRIGRSILELVIDEPAFELVAVNDLVEADNLAYLLCFDTVNKRFPKAVVIEGGDLTVAGRNRVVDGDPLKLMSWYDNEWGYANEMLRQALAMTGGCRI